MIRSASFPFAENACDEGGRKKFAVLETKRGIEVEEIGRFFEALQENQDRNHCELPEAIGYMNARLSGLLAAMERKKRLLKGALEEEGNSKFFKGVLILEEKLTEVEIEADAELRQLKMEKRKVEPDEPRFHDSSSVVSS